MQPRSFFLVLSTLSASAWLAACSAGDESSPNSGVTGGSNGGSGSTIVVSGGSGSGTSVSGGSSGTGIVISDPDAGPDDSCDSIFDVTFRDFSEAHPDFEMAFRGDVVRRTLVEPTLGANSKPVFRDSVGCPFKKDTPLDCDTDWNVTMPVITSAETFAQWYVTTPGVNQEFNKQLALVESPPGSGEYVYETADFFPLEPTEGFGVTPANHHLGKNFLFTTEIHVMFTYAAGQKFSFRGDDDLWIFVNGKLALDLGGMHGAEEGTIDFDAQAAALGITPGNSYSMDIFHAERHTDLSNFKFTTNISCFTPVVVK
jgi:fibro-slime domain-containing protein